MRPSVRLRLPGARRITAVHALREAVNKNHEAEKGRERRQIQQQGSRLVAILLEHVVEALLRSSNSEGASHGVIEGDEIEAENLGHCGEENGRSTSNAHVDYRQVRDEDQ